ncbi:MAG: hypothetical protein LVQ97_04475 [Candidatus Micrarchaeales archaeon]|jgi:ABC-type branched-subunit amino acid transport system substrate-binding protein|uniref:Uncharacterized protein n=1 Tax=Candidatus Micrarchaeum acidiphilum ARMAN-2 TaxID=425595 RepID=C7DH29_MICA2|nr:MAG: hypothetical protein UNLARM2_0375 [Candidatus Micrarchaeum acidiphilum ARMAN-2]MCW6161412.1 hypothetical protein [Candidatus Micrarchaeales archaeon]
MNIQKMPQSGEMEKKSSVASIIRKEVWPPATIPLRKSSSGQEFFEKMSDTFKNSSIRYRTLAVYNAALAVAEAAGAAWSIFSGAGASMAATFSIFGGVFATLSGFSYLRMKRNKAISKDLRGALDMAGEAESATRT